MQNRNNYLKLLLLMLECEDIVCPFDVFPGDTVIIMKKQEYGEIINKIERKLMKNKDGSCKSSNWVSPSTSVVRKCDIYSTKSKK